jgi:riboflavin synthase
VFTGLVADLGAVQRLVRDGEGATMSISTALAGELTPGDSVSVNGVCLTAVRVSDGGFDAQAMNETLACSALADLQAGSPVNVELALRPTDRIGGHIVQGHVDGVGTVRAVREDGFARVLEISSPSGLMRYLVLKGSIAVDGVSLTVSGVHDDRFSVSLIPETLERTSLGALGAGARVNLEVDVLAKHVERLMEARV